ncbi:MAG: glycosyltransferase family 4 protein, partial [Pseudomonadota bacterium]
PVTGSDRYEGRQIFMKRAAFALPGDIETLTGGYIYDRHLVDGLRGRGWDVEVLSFGTSFPNPTAEDQADASAQLARLPGDCPVIIDGLAFGAMDPNDVSAVKAPIIAMVHHPLAFENGISEDDSALLFESERANLGQAAHVIVPSPHTSQMLQQRYDVSAAQITVARPGTIRPTSFPAPQDPPLLLSVGIQVPRKGHDVLLRALAHILDLPWTAAIVGGVHDTAHGAHLAELLIELGLPARVEMPGRVPHEALSRYYAQASVFALATRYEGYGIVFDEATVHGLPIVSCRVGAVPGTVAPDAGLLVPPDDPVSFADALRRVLVDSALRQGMAAAASNAAHGLSTWQRTAEIVEQVLAGMRP